MVSGSGLATFSVQPHSVVLSLGSDVDPATSRGPETKNGVGDVEGGEGVAADSIEAGPSPELSVKFTSPPQQRKGGHSPTLQELMVGGGTS